MDFKKKPQKPFLQTIGLLKILIVFAYGRPKGKQ